MGTHVDADQWDPVVVVDDGDPASQSAWRDADEPLANRTHFLRRRTYGGEAGDYLEQPLVLQPGFSDWAVQQVLALPLGISQTNATGHLALIIPLTNLPKNGKIVEAGMIIQPDSGHSFPIGQMPRLRIYRTDPGSSSAPTVVADVTDATPSGSYENPHAVVETGMTEVIAHDSGARYHAVITGEDAGNAQTGLVVTSLYVIVDPS